MNWETLMCFGDSITIGARSYCGYPEYAGHYLEEVIGNKWNVFNFAVSGHTAMDLHRRISDNFNNLLSVNPSIVTILIGTNDIKCNTSADDFMIAYNLIVTKAKLIAMNANVVMIRIPMLPEKVMYPYNVAMNDRIREFNSLLETLAADQKVRLTEFTITSQDLFDGVHLNASGSRSLGKQLAGFILADKGVSVLNHDINGESM